ncbi:MAG: AsmA family protein, partial [Candidatus Rokubacteria bacterium]|nr:AsmA family protein [Candidatus Rokubacteria bacterium]
MSRFGRWVLTAAAAIVVLAVAAVVALPFLVDTRRVQTLIASNASHALGRPVRFEAVSVSVFPLPAVELRGLEVAEDPRFGTGPFVRLDRGQLRLRLGPLLQGRLEFGDLILKKPVAAVIQDAAGRWNFASLGAPAPGPRPGPSRPRGSPGTGAGGGVLASRVKLDGGVVTYVSRGRGGAAGAYRLEDVDLTLTPDAGSFAVGGSARLMPGAVAITLTDVTMTPNGARALTEAKLAGRLGIDGKDLTSLVATVLGPEPSIGGGVKGALSLDGTVGLPRASG